MGYTSRTTGYIGVYRAAISRGSEASFDPCGSIAVGWDVWAP